MQEPGVIIVPYCEVDGIRTFKNSEIMGFYEQMKSDGIADIVFHAGDVGSADDFLMHMKSPRVMLFVVYVDEVQAGLVWVTHMEFKTCRCHFTAFSSIWGRKDIVKIGRAAYMNVLYLKDRENKYLFDVILGLVPAWNAKAINRLAQAGVVPIGEIPNILWDAKAGKSIPGMMFYATREGGANNG